MTPLQVRTDRLALIGRLADDLAHEVKNPLHAMVINLELLRRRIEAGEAESALDRARIIEHETYRVNRLVDALLLLLRRSGKPELARFDDLIDEILPVVEALAAAARLRFVSRPAETEAYVFVRRDAVAHAVLNVVIFAIDAIGANGGGLELHAAADEIEARIRITGFAPDASPRTPATTGQTDSSGKPMRLAVARTIADDAGGRLDLDDAEAAACGAAILLAFPRAPAGLTARDRDG